MRTYFFRAGNQPAQSFDVSVDGLCTGDGINTYTLHTQAEHHARFLAYLYGVPVRLWPKDKPENTTIVEYNPEHVETIAV